MSNIEYIDLYIKAQETGIYHMYTFDIVNSKEMPREFRQDAQEKMVILMERFYKEIERIEQYFNKKILVKEETINTFNNLPEPFLYGDTFGFTIYRDSLDKEIIMNIYEELVNELDIEFDFHINDGYYETNEYKYGGILFYRGYAFSIISNLHKKDIKRLIKRMKGN